MYCKYSERCKCLRLQRIRQQTHLLTLKFKKELMKFISIILFIIIITAAILFYYYKKPSIEHHNDHTVINNHGGGVVYKELHKIAEYKKPIKIKGNCGSSCTLAFKYEDTCVYQEAQIMFHAPRSPDNTINEAWFNIMQNNYPSDIKTWFSNTLDGKDYWFSGKEMNKKFNTPLCE